MSDDIYNRLYAPFPTEYISWRVGRTNEKFRKDGEPLKGMALCYVDARAVMDRLDMVMGCDGWQNNYSPGVGNSIVCNLGLRIAGDWLWKADGAGPSDFEADKGALSDAFKRAAVRWGVARYLYDMKSPKVILETRGKTSFIPDETLQRLNALHDQEAQRLVGASPSGYAPRSGEAA